MISPDGKEFVVDVLSARKEPSVVLIDGVTRQALCSPTVPIPVSFGTEVAFSDARHE